MKKKINDIKDREKNISSSPYIFNGPIWQRIASPLMVISVL